MLYLNLLSVSRRALGCGLLIMLSFAPARAKALFPSTGRTVAIATLHRELPSASIGGKEYAEVSSVWLRQFYDKYRSELAGLGIVKWDERFDCRRFAGMFTELAQTEFFLKAFHERVAANTLALGQVWYRPDNSLTGHAIVVAFTERGRVFLDPQNGRELTLSLQEENSIYMVLI